MHLSRSGESSRPRVESHVRVIVGLFMGRTRAVPIREARDRSRCPQLSFCNRKIPSRRTPEMRSLSSRPIRRTAWCAPSPGLTAWRHIL